MHIAYMSLLKTFSYLGAMSISVVYIWYKEIIFFFFFFDNSFGTKNQEVGVEELNHGSPYKENRAMPLSYTALGVHGHLISH